MIIGIGTDIVEIDRIEKAISNKAFLDKIYTEDEIISFKSSIQSLAGAYSAKEACSKALGTGFRSFMPKDIEVRKDELGKPYIVMYKGAKDLCEQLKVSNIQLSISHCKNYALAYVLLESEERS